MQRTSTPRRYGRLGPAAGAALLLVSLIAMPASAELHPGAMAPFTQDEIDQYWAPDRQAPSGGWESVSAFGRENVLQISHDMEEVSDTAFNRTEGLKNTEERYELVSVDLYMDPAWENQAVRAALWAAVVGHDESDERAFGILEFANNQDHYGWRVYEGNLPDPADSHWIPLDHPIEFGGWTTLAIEFDGAAQEFIYSVDEQEVATTTSGPISQEGEPFIEVILNSFNYGHPDNQELLPDHLEAVSYDVHWAQAMLPEVDPPGPVEPDPDEEPEGDDPGDTSDPGEDPPAGDPQPAEATPTFTG